MLADEVDYVIGVDTHRDQHVLAVVSAPVGAVVRCGSVSADASGYAMALRVAGVWASGRRVWAVEGSGSYGAGLARFLAGRGEMVVEMGRGARTGRRLSGKDDVLDAIRTARAALSGDRLAVPRAGDHREALRVLVAARRSAVDVRRQALVQLRAVIVTSAEPLRAQLRRLPERQLVARCSRLRRVSAPPDQLATRLVLQSLARRIHAATTEAHHLEREILTHVQALAPTLLDEPGIGAIVAAQLLISWSHPGRVRSEAAFARLAGVAPIPATSGQTHRHRLSRGGDRQLNRALHTIALHRQRHDPATRDYIAQRLAQGKTRRDATRHLKRYLARHIYRLLEHPTHPPLDTP